jgi:hypothetical protein
MRGSYLLALMMMAAPAAFAQEAPYTQTLDEQAERLRAGNKPVPLDTPLPPSAVADPVVKGSATPARGKQDWPQAAAAKMDMPEGAPVAIAAPRFYRDRNGEVIDSIGGGATPAMPLTIMEAGDVRFITGGVGDEEKDMLKSVEKDFNVQLMITGMQGEFISDAGVRIIDGEGKTLVNTADAGPYFYADLPAGEYSAEVTLASGNMKQVTLKVPAKKTLKQQVRF